MYIIRIKGRTNGGIIHGVEYVRTLRSQWVSEVYTSHKRNAHKYATIASARRAARSMKHSSDFFGMMAIEVIEAKRKPCILLRLSILGDITYSPNEVYANDWS